ncbi:hypothetical protein Psuf_042410 [Phytohabitans suffuscus]|uniref:Uncharacterized protein n=1 Tax=Phytohabitans suffuscus TaxID=624315 RepID=A0A6F8YLU0_9ACTN|nr:hypothetical protein [Phytohabitans suffuscus]BCB86928.1 hypothetical protein Psuf_042410 [Phytohabitans suffuscus]
MSLIPDELAEVVHRAATGTAAYPTDLGEVERRWRRRRRRRAVVGTAGVAVLVALSLAAVPVVTARTGPDRTPAVAADKPVQRLVVGGGTWARMAEDVTEGVSSTGAARRRSFPTGGSRAGRCPLSTPCTRSSACRTTASPSSSPPSHGAVDRPERS